MRTSFLSLILASASLASTAFAQDRPIDGLVLPTAEQLELIPDASLPFGGTLPSSVDLSSQLPPPGDQGQLNSCVGWAVAYALKTFHERQEENWSITGEGGELDQSRVFSPLFVYNQINDGQNRPTSFVDALNILVTHGAAPLNAMPNDLDFTRRPDRAAFAAAARYRIQDWQEVPLRDIVHTKSQLSQGRPVVIGILVDESYPSVRGDHILSNYGGRNRSGHAMVVVGYDDDRQAFRVLNSWGRQWGDNGYGWISYEHYQRATQAAFVLFDAPNGAAPVATPVTTPPTRLTTTITPTIPAEQARLQILGVSHNYQLDPMTKAMVLNGVVSLPAGVTGQMVAVARFGYANGVPLRAADVRYAMPDGQSAASTGPQVLTGQPVNNVSYTIIIPYCALGAPSGVVCVGNPFGQLIQTPLIGTVTLFVNGQGVAQTAPFLFTVVQ